MFSVTPNQSLIPLTRMRSSSYSEKSYEECEESIVFKIARDIFEIDECGLYDAGWIEGVAVR